MIVGPSPPQRVFIDCTRTFQANVHTGIDRVVRGLIKAMATVGPQLGVECTPIMFLPHRGFVALDGDAIARRFGALGPTGAESGRFRSLTHRALERTQLLGAAALCKGALNETLTALQTGLRRFSRPGISFAQGDIVVLPDVAWNTPFWNDLRLARQNGARVCLCVYDLILLRYPECAPPRIVALFDAWWRNASAVADSFLCISQATWDEVREHLRQHQPSRRLHGGSFRLGAELDRLFGSEPVRREARELFELAHRQPVYLQVGLMSPRKNYELALNAFEKLWKAGAPAALVIVGKYGWGCSDLVAKIKSHSENGKRLFWFENVGDDELDYLYRRATALLTTSHAEGFNLPIVEALSRGTSVIATDLPAHREVAGRFAAYFPPHDAEALCELLRQHANGAVRDLVLSPAEFHWPGWRESCSEFLHEVLALSAGASEPPAGFDNLRRAA